MKLTLCKLFALLSFFITMAAGAQDRMIQGTVTYDAGVPLTGATVQVEQTNQGTTTDFDGNYSISVANG